MPWRSWFLRGLVSAASLAVFVGVFAAGFVTGRFVDHGGDAPAAQPDLNAMLPPGGVTICSKGWAQVNQAVQSGGTGAPQAPSGGGKCGA